MANTRVAMPRLSGSRRATKRKKRAKRRQTDIAGADRVAALRFKVVEKVEHAGGIEIGNP